MNSLLSTWGMLWISEDNNLIFVLRDVADFIEGNEIKITDFSIEKDLTLEPPVYRIRLEYQYNGAQKKVSDV